MPEFSLPHDHGAHGHTEDLYRELKNVEHFGAVCDIFKQLSDPTRVRIFWLLSHREECVINIAALLDMSSPAVSHHLRSLAQSGLIESRRCGKEVYYKAGDTMQIKLLHEIVEQVMQIACPEKAVDYQDSQEQIIRHAAALDYASQQGMGDSGEYLERYLGDAYKGEFLKLVSDARTTGVPVIASINCIAADDGWTDYAVAMEAAGAAALELNIFLQPTDRHRTAQELSLIHISEPTRP